MRSLGVTQPCQKNAPFPTLMAVPTTYTITGLVLHSLWFVESETTCFMANTQGQRDITPSTINRMDVTATHATAGDRNINVTVLKGLQLELLELEVLPFLLIGDDIAFCRLGVRHCS